MDIPEMKSGTLSDEERARLLAIIDRMIQAPPSRPQEEVEREIAEVRAARRRGGRRTPVERERAS